MTINNIAIITPKLVGVLLAQIDDNSKKIDIYYISGTFVGYELNYAPMEKAYLPMVFSTQNLFRYMLTHTVYHI